MSNRIYRIGTDCSGIEAPIEALFQMGIKYSHEFSCEINPHARASAKANHPSKIVYTDIFSRDHSLLPNIDIYVCGFPCQSFSTLGPMNGTNTKSGTIIYECLNVIRIKKPEIFILENVKGILSPKFKDVISYIINSINELGIYNLDISTYNTKKYGIEQNRERVYFVGVKKPKTYIVPNEIPILRSVSDILDISIKKSHLKNELTKNKANILNELIVINPNLNICNLNGSVGRLVHKLSDVCPTILATNLLYSHKLNRNLVYTELLEFQGFRKNFIKVVSDRQMITQIGNSMSVNVLIAIFRNLL